MRTTHVFWFDSRQKRNHRPLDSPSRTKFKQNVCRRETVGCEEPDEHTSICDFLSELRTGIPTCRASVSIYTAAPDWRGARTQPRWPQSDRCLIKVHAS